MRSIASQISNPNLEKTEPRNSEKTTGDEEVVGYNLVVPKCILMLVMHCTKTPRLNRNGMEDEDSRLCGIMRLGIGHNGVEGKTTKTNQFQPSFNAKDPTGQQDLKWGRGIIVIRKKQQVKEIAGYTMSHCSRGNGVGGRVVQHAHSGYTPTACWRRLSEDGGAPRGFDDGDGESWGVARWLL